MHIKIWTNRVQYEFDLFEKYNVLKGNSATGKTTLCETIDLIDIHACNINSPIACVNLPNRDYEILLKTVQGVLYVIDENHPIYLKGDYNLCRLLKDSNNYFILINRDIVRGLPISIESMFQLKSSGKFHTFENLYPFQPIKEFVYIDKIITEDTMSSNKFLSNYFNCPCIPSGGKDFMPDTLLNHPEGDILVMYDSLSAGFLEEDIIFEASKRRGKTYIIRPKSFEKYILDSKMINEDFTIKEPIHKLEDAYERKLSYVLPFNYSKSSLSPCLLKECNTLNNEKCLYCGYRVPIGKKLEYLSHSGLEYIRVRGIALG